MNIKKVYKHVAKKHCESTEKIEKDMQEAILFAWENSLNSSEVVSVQNKVISKERIPTVEELIKYVVMEVKR